MTEIQQRKLGTWLIAAGALLVGIGSAEAQVERLVSARLPQYWASVLAIVGILCVAVGVLLWLMSRVPPMFGRTMNVIKLRRKTWT